MSTFVDHPRELQFTEEADVRILYVRRIYRPRSRGSVGQVSGQTQNWL